MAHVVILGAGTAGTLMANRLRRRLAAEIEAGATDIIVIDQDDRHLYQPGLLFVPFGVYHPHELVRSRRAQLHEDVTLRTGIVVRLNVEERTVALTTGERIPYDVCIIASGAALAPEATEGLLGPGWRDRVFDFYTLEGATALGHALDTWKGGRLVVHVADTPVKCAVAPLEFAFLADWFFTMRGVRGDVDIAYVTPLDGAFTHASCTRAVGHLLADKGISLVPEFRTRRVDGAAGRLLSGDGRVQPFDLLVTVPRHVGASFVRQTPGLGDDAGFVRTHPRTMQTALDPSIFAIGDATNLPAAKAASVAHYEGEVLEENVARYLDGVALAPAFDGHASCFVETGFERAFVIDFNYDTEPLPGKFPLASVGPLSLLEESHVNHLGRMAFKWIYWNVVLAGHDIPGIRPQMSMHGKQPLAPAS